MDVLENRHVYQQLQFGDEGRGEVEERSDDDDGESGSGLFELVEEGGDDLFTVGLVEVD